MLMDPDSQEYRQMAVTAILQIRENKKQAQLALEQTPAAKRRPGRPPKPPPSVRQFKKVYGFNMKAQTLLDLLDFSQLQDLEPPLTMDVAEEDLLAQVEDFSPLSNIGAVPSIPNNTQGVERMVQMFHKVVAPQPEGKGLKTHESRLHEMLLQLKYNSDKRASASRSANTTRSSLASEP